VYIRTASSEFAMDESPTGIPVISSLSNWELSIAALLIVSAGTESTSEVGFDKSPSRWGSFPFCFSVKTGGLVWAIDVVSVFFGPTDIGGTAVDWAGVVDGGWDVLVITSVFVGLGPVPFVPLSLERLGEASFLAGIWISRGGWEENSKRGGKLWPTALFDGSGADVGCVLVMFWRFAASSESPVFDPFDCELPREITSATGSGNVEIGWGVRVVNEHWFGTFLSLTTNPASGESSTSLPIDPDVDVDFVWACLVVSSFILLAGGVFSMSLSLSLPRALGDRIRRGALLVVPRSRSIDSLSSSSNVIGRSWVPRRAESLFFFFRTFLILGFRLEGSSVIRIPP
jgi:hypothetical protein